MEKKDENKRPRIATARHLRAKREISFQEKPVEKPNFQREKHLFQKRSFRRQFRLFRKGGLGFFDSLFNTFYITLCENNVEREKKRLGRKGRKEVPAVHYLELDSRSMKLLSSFLRFFGNAATRIRSFFLFFWKKNDGAGARDTRLAFFKNHIPHFAVIVLAVFVAFAIYAALSKPVIVRAQINSKTIAVVENTDVINSAINELEDNVAIILGKSFVFPYEVEFTLARQHESTITTKDKISDVLYTYILDSICTASGLYVDHTLVAVCQTEGIIREELDHFLAEYSGGKEMGIFNDIQVVTQAYPTSSLIGREELHDLLDEMAVPIKDRVKNNIVAEAAPPTPTPDSNASVPVHSQEGILTDVQCSVRQKTASVSNQPQPIDDLELSLYTCEVITYKDIIPYQTVYQESAKHYTTMADVTTRGVNGSATVEAKVYYVNGVEAKREILSQVVHKQPVNEVVSIGTKLLPEDLGITSPYAKEGRFIVPKVGYVSFYYGSREDGFHRAWDIPGNKGDNIYAAASGKVIAVRTPQGLFSNVPGKTYSGYGLVIVLEHEDGFSTLYAHCSAVNVVLGQEVKQGEKIGEVGNTGNSEGNHVHFEIMRNFEKLNPKKYLYEGTLTIYDQK